MDVDLSGNSVQFRREVFNGGLQKQNVRQTTFARLSVNFFGDFFQRATISVDSDEEFLRTLARAPVDKKAVSGPNIYNYSALVRGDEFLESSAIQLSSGSTAN